MKRRMAILWVFAVLLTIVPSMSTAQSFTYPPAAAPVVDADPGRARPVAVGPVATGGSTLALQVSTTTFPAPMDMYLGLFAPFFSPEIFLFASDTTVQPLSQATAKWRANVTSANMPLLGNIPTAGLPQGTYFLLLLVTPANSLASFTLWQTSFTVGPPPVSPQADSYTWIGNTPLTVPAAQGVLANDPAGSTISASTTQTTGGGTVAVNPDGGFVYTPAIRFRGSDTFTYTVTGFAPTTVSIQIDSLAFYVDNTAAAGGNGSFNSRFSALAAAVAAAIAGDTIFVYAGDGLATNQDAGITLLAGQKLLGQGAAFTFPVLPGTPIEIVPAGTRPVLSDANGLVGAPVITLAGNNEVAGFSLTSGNTEAILGNGVSGYDIHDNLIPNANGSGIFLSNASGSGRIANNVVTNSGQDGIFIEMLNTVNLTAQASVTGNRIDGTGGLGGGIIAEIAGANQLRIALRNNQVSNTNGESGIFLLSDDASELGAVVNGNILQDNQGAVGPADFGARSRGGSSLCLELTNNVSNTAGVGVVAYLIENDSLPGAPPPVAVFQLFETNNIGTIQQTGAITTVPAGTCALP